MQTFVLWEDPTLEEVTLEYYRPLQKSTNIAVVIFAGGAYTRRAKHEGEGYAHLLNTFGISAFVVNYRVYPNCFPSPLMDARRAIRFVRGKAAEFEVDPNKVLVMGSSAGGHLAALVSTYLEDIGEVNDELMKQSFLPNGQILCYPVISTEEGISHESSFEMLLGDLYEQRNRFSVESLVNKTTPSAFIWHTSDDNGVSCINSYRYAEALARENVPCEMHIFPNGGHGAGIATQLPHVAQWTGLLRRWLNKYY